MCFLFNVRMNHYYSCCCFFLRTLSSLNLTEKAWTKTSKKHIDFTLSVCVSCCQAKIYIYVVCNQAAQSANACTWTFVHTYTHRNTFDVVDNNFCMHYFCRLRVSFSLLFSCVWTELKRSEKHKTLDDDQSDAHIYGIGGWALCRSQCVSVFSIQMREKKHQQQHNKIRIHRIKQ